MNIGEAARHADMSAKTIRYYESVGLIVSPTRGENGYRAYTDEDVHMLRFIARARGLGFSVADCRLLVALYVDRERESADVRHLAMDHIARIDEKVAELQSMRTVLEKLVRQCKGDNRPDCPILEELSRP